MSLMAIQSSKDLNSGAEINPQIIKKYSLLNIELIETSVEAAIAHPSCDLARLIHLLCDRLNINFDLTREFQFVLLAEDR